MTDRAPADPNLTSPRPWEDCMICGKRRPTGHVVVHDGRPGAKREGVICSSHSFAEVILDSTDRFYVEIIMDKHLGGIDALERAQAERLGRTTPKGRRSRYTSSPSGGDKEVPTQDR